MLVASCSSRPRKVAASPPPAQLKVPSATEQPSVVKELPTPPAAAHLLTRDSAALACPQKTVFSSRSETWLLR